MKKERKKEKIHRAMFVIKCSECGMILASASEIMYLPDFTTCNFCNKKK